MYAGLAEKAITQLLPICSLYLWEKTFSSLVHIKNKCRNQLDVKPDFWIHVSNIELDITHLVTKIAAESFS